MSTVSTESYARKQYLGGEQAAFGECRTGAGREPGSPSSGDHTFQPLFSGDHTFQPLFGSRSGLQHAKGGLNPTPFVHQSRLVDMETTGRSDFELICQVASFVVSSGPRSAFFSAHAMVRWF